jgi:hypothetical protein
MFEKLFFLASFILILALAGNAGAQLDPAAVSDGHVYLLDDVSGGQVPDDSANSNTGTIVGDPQVIAGMAGGNALQFDGVDDGVDIPDSANINVTGGPWQNRTVVAVFKCDDVDKTTKQTIFEEGGNTRGMTFYVHEGLLYAAAWNRAEYNWDGAWLSTPIESGIWYGVAMVVRDGAEAVEDDKFEMWLDGQLIAKAPGGQIHNHSNDNAIGYTKQNNVFHDGNAGADGHWFEGAIDEVWIVNTALGQVELNQFAGKVWPFAFGPDPADGALLENTWANLAWSPGGYAVSHDVYFGTSFDDVNQGAEGTFIANTSEPVQIVGFPGFPRPEGLVPGTTYYWRVDEVNDANAASPWKGDVWSFWIPPKTAYNAEPADGMQFIPTDVTLSWTGGFGAKLHNVYFGENFEDVNNAVGAPPTPDPTFTPEPLEAGKTYYWRVDEFDGAATNKGDVWSFTTVPEVEVTNPDLKLWWNLDEGMGTTAVDWSGHGNHGTINGGAAWVGGYLGSALLFGEDVYVESDYEGITGTAPRTCSAWVRTANTGNHNIMSWGQNETGQKWRMRVNGDNGVLRIEVNGGYHYGVTTIADGSWHHVAVTFEDDGTPDVVDTLLYVDGQRDATDVSQATEINTGNGPVRIGESPWHNAPFLDVIDDARIYDRVLTAEEIQLAMRIDPQLAWDPVPANETLAPMNFASEPSWSAGDGVSQYDVYFGSDRDAVETADASDTTGIYRGRQNATSYELPEGVEPDTGPFYWRVDSVTSDGTIVTGRLWNFTVADHALVDDFETYNDIPAGEPGSNLVYVTWVDGFDNPNVNGSTMGYVTGISMETDTVLSGSQSVPLQYNNTTAGVSEVVRTFTPARDWMANDMQTLSLSFVGSGTNVPGQLYIKVNGVQVNYPGNRSNLTLAGWQSWNIPLASINANLSNVTSMAVGIQGAGATGMLILDNIRLYPQEPETIAPVQPDPAGLVLHYAFEGNTNDSAGANQGTAFGSPTYVMGKIGQAIMLDGLDDYVAIDNFSYASQGHTEITVSAWIRTAVEGNQIIVSFDRNEYWRLEINGDGGGPGEAAWDVMTDTGQVDYESSGGSTTCVDDDQWHHVAGVFDNGTVTLYIDGNPQRSAFGGATFGTGTPRFGYVGLGSESTEFNLEPRTPASYFTGAVDDVRIYDRALTDAEVAGLAGRTTAFDKPF